MRSFRQWVERERRLVVVVEASSAVVRVEPSGGLSMVVCIDARRYVEGMFDG